MIEQIAENEYRLVKGGHTMTLSREPHYWLMYTENASTKAWNSGHGGFKQFPDLKAIEAHYKSWRGISALVN